DGRASTNCGLLSPSRRTDTGVGTRVARPRGAARLARSRGAVRAYGAVCRAALSKRTRVDPATKRAKMTDNALIAADAERLLGRAQLAADQAGIEAATHEELGVIADFDEAPAVEHREEVGVAHGRQPMRNDDCRAVAHQ